MNTATGYPYPPDTYPSARTTEQVITEQQIRTYEKNFVIGWTQITGAPSGFAENAAPAEGRTVANTADYLANNAVVNVLDWGAAADGVADDTAAINAAKSVAKLTKRPLYFPAGTFKISSTITVDSSMYVFGQGRTQSVLKVDPAAATRFIPLLVQSADFSPIYGTVIRDLGIDGSGKGLLDSGLLQVNCAEGFVIHNVKVWNGGTPGESASAGVGGIVVSAGSLAGTAAPIGHISHCEATACTKGGFNSTTGVRAITISDCLSHHNTGNGETPGFQINGGPRSRLTNCIAEDNQGRNFIIAVSGGPGYGWSAYSEWTALVNCHSRRSGRGSVSGAGFAVMNGATQDDPYGPPRGNITLIGCTSEDSGVEAGFVVQHMDDVSLIGCTSDGSYTHGYLFQNSRRVTALGCVAKNNNTANLGAGAGFYVIAATPYETERIHIANCPMHNEAGSRQKYPVYFDLASGSVKHAEFFDNPASGHETSDAPGGSWPEGFEMRHSLEVKYNDAAQHNVVIGTLEDTSAYTVETSVVGRTDDGGDRAWYKRAALAYRNGGGATLQGGVTDVLTNESAAGWNSTIDATANVVFVTVLGQAEPTTWRVHITVRAPS